MSRNVYLNETSDVRRHVYFQLVDVVDGMTPELGEAGGQPELSVNGAAWNAALIGPLVSIGFGRYYAVAAVAAFQTLGNVIESRYKSANTAECPGDTLFVVPYPEGGVGAIAFTYTVTNSVTAVGEAGVEVWVTSDVGGTLVIAGPQLTDAAGQVVFYLDAGTYYFWRRKAGFVATNPDTEVVSA